LLISDLVDDQPERLRWQRGFAGTDQKVFSRGPKFAQNIAKMAEKGNHKKANLAHKTLKYCRVKPLAGPDDCLGYHIRKSGWVLLGRGYPIS
jgi:hypothetical protein